MPKVLSWEEKQKRWTEAAERNAERKAARAKKDQEVLKRQRAAYRKANPLVIQLRITHATPLPEILERVVKEQQIPYATYARKALIAQLKRDGYIAYEEPYLK